MHEGAPGIIVGFPQWSWLLALLIGAAVGNILNRYIYRYFSKRISVRYFLVELLVGGLCAGLWHQYLIASFEPVRMWFYMLAAAALVAIIFIDWALFVIPDEINVFVLAIGVGHGAATHQMKLALLGALTGWGIIWGTALLGRVMFRRDAMGHGDIKMMRGVGALIGPALTFANMAIAVVAGLVVGIALIVAARKGKEEGASADDESPPPESISSLLKSGIFYLLCLDCVGVFWRGIYRLIGEEYQEVTLDDDTWKPSLTTIPFGPYLAAGALVCMLFATPLANAIHNYWNSFP
jgi:leader peptidase (prepilin peptidase)/N-methyltransferase